MRIQPMECPSGGPWIRVKDTPPEPDRIYWVVWHTLKYGHQMGFGQFLSHVQAWEVNGSGPHPNKRKRSRVLFYAERHWPE